MTAISCNMVLLLSNCHFVISTNHQCGFRATYQQSIELRSTEWVRQLSTFRSVLSVYGLTVFIDYILATTMNPLLSPVVGSVVSMDAQSFSTGAQHSLQLWQLMTTGGMVRALFDPNKNLVCGHTSITSARSLARPPRGLRWPPTSPWVTNMEDYLYAWKDRLICTLSLCMNTGLRHTVLLWNIPKVTTPLKL